MIRMICGLSLLMALAVGCDNPPPAGSDAYVPPGDDAYTADRDASSMDDDGGMSMDMDAGEGDAGEMADASSMDDASTPTDARISPFDGRVIPLDGRIIRPRDGSIGVICETDPPDCAGMDRGRPMCCAAGSRAGEWYCSMDVCIGGDCCGVVES